MITTKRLIQIGSSLGFVVDKDVLEYLKIKKGDLIEIKIKKCQN
jgi:hypothetical protein